MENKELRLQLRELFVRVFHQMRKLQRTPIPLGSKESLFVAELAILEIVGYSPGINITELAKKQGKIFKPLEAAGKQT